MWTHNNFSKPRRKKRTPNKFSEIRQKSAIFVAAWSIIGHWWTYNETSGSNNTNGAPTIAHVFFYFHRNRPISNDCTQGTKLSCKKHVYDWSVTTQFCNTGTQLNVSIFFLPLDFWWNHIKMRCPAKNIAF